MTMPASGPLNMGGTSSPVSVAQELGLSLTATISMNQTNVRTLAGVSTTSGTSWSMSSLYGKSNTLAIEYLVVAGGGGGGGYLLANGGGGAGGYRTASANIGSGSFAVTVGAGGSGATPYTSLSIAGSNSSFNGLTSTGGGYGGMQDFTLCGSNRPPSTGGSGGGGNYQNQFNGAAGTAGQGNAGGAGYVEALCCCRAHYGGGGGGGASTAGSGLNATRSQGGAGSTWSNGVAYAGGGGGGQFRTSNSGPFSPALGGTGGGGNGGYSSSSPARNGVSGTTNTGGGGGGGSYNAPSNGGSGGSGIVIIRYAGSQVATGGTVTSAGGYTYHTFTSSGTFTK